MIIDLVQDDITCVAVDVMVNAANSSLLGGGGVDGAIHRAGGKAILEECIQIRNRQGGCAVGEAVMTTAGKLPAKKVIHTVGPVWNEGKSGEEEKLKNCYLQALRLADKSPFSSIAFPNISTGIYRFPREKAAPIAIQTVQGFSAQYLEKVIFVCFDSANFHIYQNLLGKS